LEHQEFLLGILLYLLLIVQSLSTKKECSTDMKIKNSLPVYPEIANSNIQMAQFKICYHWSYIKQNKCKL